MKHLLALLEELKTRPFKVTMTKSGTETVQQTQRNALKAELMNAIQADIQEVYEFVYKDKDGILLEIANDSIADSITNEDGSGAITACLDISIKSLEYNAESESADYAETQARKAEEKAEKDKKKQAKIARDTAEREKKKRGE